MPKRTTRAGSLEEHSIPEPNTGCKLWLGTKNRFGYGLLFYNKRRLFAHRVAYELAYGSIPDGLYVCHHCDTPECVEPTHLFIGTQFDNMRDMVAKGRAGWVRHPEKMPRGDRNGARTRPDRLPWGDRNGARTRPETRAKGERHPFIIDPSLHARGERSANSKLTEAKVREIRRRAANGERQRPLAREFGINRRTLQLVVSGGLWGWVKD